MKKILFITSIALLFTAFNSSCEKDEDNVSSYAEIKILENGERQSGVTVYMFSENKDPNSNLFQPHAADKSVVTESDGVAKFDLQETFDLDIIDTQTTLYFGVFDQDDNTLGYTGLTIKKNETKSATIEY